MALSGDGNTAIVGGRGDNSGVGAVWVYTRNSQGLWTQQGSKLVGTGADSVALSGDGNTAIVGGYGDNSAAGAAWVYVRSSEGLWTQQGGKLVGTGSMGVAQQGFSVGLSADGNTAIVGGIADNANIGAAWVYTRSASVWTQQGNKLVGTGAVGQSDQGWSVALSGDGKTAIVGGPIDNDGYPGKAWVYTRSGGVWTQQGSKLVGPGAVGQSQQGQSVALSGDGNTAIVLGPTDDWGTATIGSAWVYTRNSQGLWTQLGNKLIVTGADSGLASTALSGDGKTAIIGGGTSSAAISDIGAAWVFVLHTKNDCKNGGWLNFISSPGPFKNQGECVSYFAQQNAK